MDFDPNQSLKSSAVERMQRLKDQAIFKKRKARRLKHCLLLHIDLNNINHKNKLKLLDHISKRTKRLDAITLYTSPKELRQCIFDRLNTEDETSSRAALITLSAQASRILSSILYYRKCKK